MSRLMRRQPAWHLLSPVQQRGFELGEVTRREARELLRQRLVGVLVALQARVREQRKEQR